MNQDREPKEVEVKTVIITRLTTRGGGNTESSIRRVTEIWDVATGEVLAENDPCAPRWDIAGDGWHFNNHEG